MAFQTIPLDNFSRYLKETQWYRKCCMLHVLMSLLSMEINRSEYITFDFKPKPVKRGWVSLMTLYFY